MFLCTCCGKSGRLPWGCYGRWTGKHRTGTSELDWRGPVPVAWSGLCQGTNELIGEDLGMIISVGPVQLMR